MQIYNYNWSLHISQKLPNHMVLQTRQKETVKFMRFTAAPLYDLVTSFTFYAQVWEKKVYLRWDENVISLIQIG